MTVKDRVADISKRTGLSEDIVRRVLNEECNSITESLLKGERSTLLGRCTFIPSICNTLDVDPKTKEPIAVKSIAIKVQPSKSMLARLQKFSEENLRTTSDAEHYKIPHLATIQIEDLV